MKFLDWVEIAAGEKIASWNGNRDNPEKRISSSTRGRWQTRFKNRKKGRGEETRSKHGPAPDGRKVVPDVSLKVREVEWWGEFKASCSREMEKWGIKRKVRGHFQ